MRHTVLGAAFALSVSAVLGFGCGSGAPPSANSFTKVYAEIIRPTQPTQSTCSSDFCHYTNVGIRFSALDMSSKVRAFYALVDEPCSGASCMNIGTRVVPGDPGSSILYRKVSEANPPCGSQMPADTQAFLTNGGTAVFSGTALTADQLQLIQNWIQEGAYDN